MTVALLFPGQGSQRAGMLDALADHPASREILDRTRVLLGVEAVERLDTAGSLAATDGAQLALYIAGVAGARALIAESAEPGFVAGHSVGAFAAAVICGSLTFDEGLELVAQRGAMMRRLAGTGHGMAAITAVPRSRATALIAAASRADDALHLAIVNADDQVVVSGSADALDRLQRAGGDIVRRLDVAAPAHCPLMAPVSEMLHQRLRMIPPRGLSAIYISNTEARARSESDAVLADLAGGASQPVRWAESVALLAELGVTLLVELGPGEVLTGLARRIVPAVMSVSLEARALRDVAVLVARAA